MTQIDFYLLKPEQSGAGRDRILTILLEKAIAQKHHVYIHVSDSSEAQRLDEWLWTYKDISFIAHTRIPQMADAVPVTLGFEKPLTATRDILIQLAGGVADFYPEFARVIHLVPADDVLRQQAREQYRLYQAHGHSVQTHQL